MPRTTIVAPEELLNQLHTIASERRVSLATVIREALEEAVKHHRPKPRSLGIIDSGFADTARLSADWRIYEPPTWR